MRKMNGTDLMVAASRARELGAMDNGGCPAAPVAPSAGVEMAIESSFVGLSFTVHVSIEQGRINVRSHTQAGRLRRAALEDAVGKCGGRPWMKHTLSSIQPQLLIHSGSLKSTIQCPITSLVF